MKMIQIRNVPEEVHRALKERAARDGTTMSELLMRELPRIAAQPTPEQLFRRLERREPVAGAAGSDLVRADRDAR